MIRSWKFSRAAPFGTERSVALTRPVPDSPDRYGIWVDYDTVNGWAFSFATRRHYGWYNGQCRDESDYPIIKVAAR